MKMRILVAAIAVLALATEAHSQSRQPPPEQRSQERVEAQANSQQRNDAASPALVAAPRQHEPETEHRQPNEKAANNNGDGSVGWPTIISAIAAVVTGIFTVVLAASTILLWKETKRAAESAKDAHALARDQLTLTFPPRLRVTRPILWAHPPAGEREDRYTPPNFTPGQQIDGVAWVINYGRETAFIKDWDCAPRFLKHLPMNPPYRTNGEDRAPLFQLPAKKLVEKLEPGEMAQFQYSFTVPLSGLPEGDLFLIGRVTFRDRLDTHRAVFFARRYDFERDCFTRVEHPEYECEE